MHTVPNHADARNEEFSYVRVALRRFLPLIAIFAIFEACILTGRGGKTPVKLKELYGRKTDFESPLE